MNCVQDLQVTSTFFNFIYGFYLIAFSISYYVLKNCVYVWELELFKMIDELLYDVFL
jgi:hypothetical protein